MLFNSLYHKVLSWAEKKSADYYLALLSFAESSFFPIPVDVMLAPMVLARPARWWKLALLTTITSVLGGIAGYLIGAFAFEWIEPIIIKHGYADSINLARDWFAKWGIWVVFLAGFSPVPYKVFTITSGMLQMAFVPFVIASMIGRAARFFLVAYVVYLSADKIKSIKPAWIEWIGWATAAIAVMLYFVIA